MINTEDLKKEIERLDVNCFEYTVLSHNSAFK